MASVGGLSPNRAGQRCAPASSLSVPDIDWDAPWLADWRAWRDGDIFGWVAYGPNGDEIESSWGYYRFASSEQQYTFECAESIILAHAEEQVEKANLVGAGIVGPI